MKPPTPARPVMRRPAWAVGLMLAVTLVLSIGTAPALAATPTADPNGRFGLPLALDRYNTAAQAMASQRTSASSTTMSALSRIARQPSANWYGGSTSTVAALVRWRVEDAASRGTVAQLVTFNLPNRGCDGFVEPGPTTSKAYRAWFREFLRGLGDHKAIVVVEPDALGLASCLTRAQKHQRYALVAWSMKRLHQQGSWGYIDAGHSKWLSVDVAANRLRASGVRWAAGFSLNVSNFRPNRELIQYGTAVSKLIDGRHFVIDSGRNGAKKVDDSYCNPPGKALGRRPTAVTGVPRLDAYLWIKNPGGSDGTCRGGPEAGHWWQQYALMLVRNATKR